MRLYRCPCSFYQHKTQIAPALFGDTFVAMALAAVVDPGAHSGLADQLFGRTEACALANRTQDGHSSQQPNPRQQQEIGNLLGPHLTGTQAAQFGLNGRDLWDDVVECRQVLVHTQPLRR